MKSGERSAGRNTAHGKRKPVQLSEEEILNAFGVPAVEKSLVVSEAFSPSWVVPDIMLTSNRWKASMPKDKAVELCLICMGVETMHEVVTYEVATNDFGGYCVERRWNGRFTHWVAPPEFQVELREWKRRLDHA